MFKFLHAADIHLDSPLKGLQRYPGAPVDLLRGATRRALDNLVTLAKEEQVDFVLIAGDLYDGDWRDYNTGLFFISRMAQLQEAGISVYLISGNHDAASQLTKSLRLPDNVTLFDKHSCQTQILDHLDVAIHGQSYANRAITENLAARYPQGDPQLFNIGLLHTCLDGRAGHELYAPCHLDDLRGKGYRYWALGHVHQREVINQDPWVVFPGNIQGRSIRETGVKGCSFVCVEDDDIRVEHRALDSVRWAKWVIDIDGCATALQRAQSH